MSDKYLAYLIVKDFDDNIVGKVGVNNLSERHVEKVMSGMLINMRDDLYIDDSEVDKARSLQEEETP